MHPVLSVEQRDGLAVLFEPLKHGVRETPGANDGWKLTVVTNENETARAQYQAERERLGKLASLIHHGHFETPGPQIGDRAGTMRSGRDDPRLLKRVFDGTNGSVFHGEVFGETLRGIARELGNNLGRIACAPDAKEADGRIMLEQRDEHLIHGGIGESAQQDRTADAVHDFGDDLRLSGARRTPDQVKDLAVHRSVNGFLLAGVESCEDNRDFGIRISNFGFGDQIQAGPFPKSEFRIPNSEISQNHPLFPIHRRH